MKEKIKIGDKTSFGLNKYIPSPRNIIAYFPKKKIK